MRRVVRRRRVHSQCPDIGFRPLTASVVSGVLRRSARPIQWSDRSVPPGGRGYPRRFVPSPASRGSGPPVLPLAPSPPALLPPPPPRPSFLPLCAVPLVRHRLIVGGGVLRGGRHRWLGFSLLPFGLVLPPLLPALLDGIASSSPPASASAPSPSSSSPSAKRRAGSQCRSRWSPYS